MDEMSGPIVEPPAPGRDGRPVASYASGPPKKDRTALIVIIAVLGMLLASAAPVIIIFGLYALIGGGALGYMFFLDPGEAHVVCPVDRAIEVKLDHEDPVPVDPGDHVTLRMSRGEHAVRVMDHSTDGVVTHRLDVGSGFFEMVLPAAPQQCFVRLDMTEYTYPLYRLKDGEGLSPVVYETYRETEPFKLPSSTYLSEDEMPASLESGSSAYLLLDFPCDRLEGTDEEILHELGF